MRGFSEAKKEIEKRKEKMKKKNGSAKREIRSLSRVSRASRENEFGRSEE